MKRHIHSIIFLLIFAVDVLFYLAFAEEHTETDVRYKQTWWDGTINYVDISYIDNFVSVTADNNESELFIRLNAPSVDYPQSPYDSLRASYTRFGKFYPTFYSDTGTFSDFCYGDQGGPESKIVKKSVYKAGEEDVRWLFRTLADSFRNKFLDCEEKEDTAMLSRFCELLPAFTKSQLRILRNTIYANHGYTFKAADLNEIFKECEWYKVERYFREYEFTEKERVYLTLIKQAEENTK